MVTPGQELGAIVRYPRTKNCVVTRLRTSTKRMSSALAG